MFRKLILVVFVLMLIGGFGVGGYYVYMFNRANISKDGKLYIRSGSGFRQVTDSLAPFLKDKKSFKITARLKKLPTHLYPGRYTLKEGMSNRELIGLLTSGKQDEVSIRIGNYSSINELAGRVSPNLECDSTEIVAAIEQAAFTQNLDPQQQLYFFLPNTYNFFWATSGKQFVNKMKKQFDNFWTEERLNKAAAKNLDPLQVTTLASIVQLESKHADEQPIVAGVYLNRLKIDMKLQADPTVIFSLKQKYGSDYKTERVLYSDLTTPSPYNTYQNKGLPPAPICMPNPSAIDAVLSPQAHNYIYFVADPSRPGYHLFAQSATEHMQNARIYHQWMNNR